MTFYAKYSILIGDQKKTKKKKKEEEKKEKKQKVPKKLCKVKLIRKGSVLSELER